MCLHFLFEILGLLAKTSIFPSPWEVLCNDFFWHWLTRSIFCSLRGWGRSQQRRNLLLHGSLVRQREAGPPKSAEIFVFLTPGIAGLHFFQCSLVPISWLHGEQEGRSLNGHSAALASGQLQAGQTSAPASKHWATSGFAFTICSPTSPTAFLKFCFITFLNLLLHLKTSVLLSRR